MFLLLSICHFFFDFISIELGPMPRCVSNVLRRVSVGLRPLQFNTEHARRVMSELIESYRLRVNHWEITCQKCCVFPEICANTCIYPRYAADTHSIRSATIYTVHVNAQSVCSSCKRVVSYRQQLDGNRAVVIALRTACQCKRRIAAIASAAAAAAATDVVTETHHCTPIAAAAAAIAAMGWIAAAVCRCNDQCLHGA